MGKWFLDFRGYRTAQCTHCAMVCGQLITVLRGPVLTRRRHHHLTSRAMWQLYKEERMRKAYKGKRRTKEGRYDENYDNKTKIICANSKLELRNVTVGEVA